MTPRPPDTAGHPVEPPAPDPFGTADLRRAVLDAWAASAGRFREDANAEEALAAGGYAGRALVEMVSNAVDAAREGGVPARIRIRLRHNELRIANTGTPLTPAGVAALASLRASAKRDSLDSVGHFGVGFTAVLSWSSAPAVISTTGGVRFDAAATAAGIAALERPALDREVLLRDGQVPVLRLPWPSDPAEEPPPAGYATEVRLPLSADAVAEVERMLADDTTMRDLFWAMEDLEEIDLPGRVIRCQQESDGITTIDDGSTVRRYRSATRFGLIPAELLAGRPVEERRRSRWRVTWAVPDDPAWPAAPERSKTAHLSMIGAPTPTDEPLTVPARLVGTFPVDDTRRRIADGPLSAYLLERAADTFMDLLATAEPDARWALLPVAGFPAGAVDGALRDAILRRVAVTPLFRTAVGDLVTATDASMLPGIGAEGTALIGEAIPGLLPPLPAPAATVLRGLGVRTIGLPEASTELAGIDRPPSFWRRIYQALDQMESPVHPEDVADIPIPLTAGRRAFGASGCLLPAAREAGEPTDPAAGDAGRGYATGGRIGAELAQRIGAIVPGLRMVDPNAAHPLLERLGARFAVADAILTDPELVEQVARMRNDLEDFDPDPADVRELARVVLDLLAAGASGLEREVGRRASGPARSALADLVLSDTDGNPWPAVELMMPDAPLAPLLDPGLEIGVVGSEWIDRYGAELLVAAGARRGFTVVHVADAAGEPLELPDLDSWLDTTAAADGEPFTALADLDLVEPLRWRRALDVILADPEARACLAPSAGGPSYSGWWISRHALLDGRPPTEWRLRSAVDLEGLFDPLPFDLDPTVARWIGVRADLSAAASDPQDLLDRWADPGRQVDPARVGRLTAAVVAGLVRLDEIDLPAGVRTVAGDVSDAQTALILDEPWWAQIVPASRLVSGTDDPGLVAQVLDLALASTTLEASVVTSDPEPGGGVASGEDRDPPVGPSTSEASMRLTRAAAALALPVEAVDVTVHADLRVGIEGAEPIPVRWWGSGGHYWIDGSAYAAGRVAAWVAGRWSQRHLAVAAAASDLEMLAEEGLG